MSTCYFSTLKVYLDSVLSAVSGYRKLPNSAKDFICRSACVEYKDVECQNTPLLSRVVLETNNLLSMLLYNSCKFYLSALTLLYFGAWYITCSQKSFCMLQMVGSTRGNPEGFVNASGSGSQQPPPPPPGIAEVLAAQTELLRQLVQGQQRGGHHAHQPQAAGYQDFFATQPPLFHKTEEPLDADAWIRTIESKFALLPVPCSEENKTLFAAQQLRGSARLWWDNYHGMLPADHVVTWNEFKNAFRDHHIPEGLMERKLNEFLALTQGTRTVIQYAQVF